jgi:hypothetical protein
MEQCLVCRRLRDLNLQAKRAESTMFSSRDCRFNSSSYRLRTVGFSFVLSPVFWPCRFIGHLADFQAGTPDAENPVK